MHKISKEQMRALDGSIEKWRKIVYNGGFDNTSNNCSLCQFNQRCINCIIYHETGESGCNFTPYTEWRIHHRYEHRGSLSIKMCMCNQCIKLATNEYEFLKDLKTKCEVSIWKSITEPFVIFMRNIICI